jgi:hypothetical protein
MYLKTYHLVLEEVLIPPSSHQEGIPGVKPNTRRNVCTSGLGVLQDGDITVK